MKKPIEDIIVETVHTRITSYTVDSEIIVAACFRDSPSAPWEWANDEYMSVDKFENVRDTLSYLAIKYRSEIGGEQ